MSTKDNAKWKLILYCMKFVDVDSLDEMLPEYKDSSKRNKIKKLRELLNKLPDDKKRKLIDSREAAEAELKIKGYKEKANKAKVGIGSTMGTVGGAAATFGGVGYSTGASIIGGASAAGSITAGVFVSFLGAIVSIINLGIAALGILFGAIGAGMAISGNRKTNVYRKQATMMTKDEIINTIKNSNLNEDYELLSIYYQLHNSFLDEKIENIISEALKKD